MDSISSKASFCHLHSFAFSVRKPRCDFRCFVPEMMSSVSHHANSTQTLPYSFQSTYAAQRPNQTQRSFSEAPHSSGTQAKGPEWGGSRAEERHGRREDRREQGKLDRGRRGERAVRVWPKKLKKAVSSGRWRGRMGTELALRRLGREGGRTRGAGGGEGEE